ncbi:MAG: hypothetical protein SYNGOMJ08_00684 [Candidatus Syntrophoarchaeum sp. GoM_oil]|nr:MAG: hypothetical protein SYNGOMJ08_00684 [Candidatus Syntrophoarchaeum sp. GoM_oil]
MFFKVLIRFLRDIHGVAEKTGAPEIVDEVNKALDKLTSID